MEGGLVSKKSQGILCHGKLSFGLVLNPASCSKTIHSQSTNSSNCQSKFRGFSAIHFKQIRELENHDPEIRAKGK